MSLRVNRFENFAKCQKTWKNDRKGPENVLRNTVIAFLLLFSSWVAVAQGFAGFQPTELPGFFLDGQWVNGSQGATNPNMLYETFIPGEDPSFLMVDANQNYVFSFKPGQQHDGTSLRDVFHVQQETWAQAGFGNVTTLRAMKLDASDETSGLVSVKNRVVEIYKNISTVNDTDPRFTSIKSFDSSMTNVQAAAVDLTGNGEQDLLLLKWSYQTPELFALIRPETGWEDLDVGNLNFISMNLPQTLPDGRSFARLLSFTRGTTSYVMVQVETTLKVFELDYSGAGQDPNGLGALASSGAQDWFQNVPIGTSKEYCLFNGPVDGTAGDYLVLLEASGIAQLYYSPPTTGFFTRTLNMFLYADFGRLSSPAFGDFYDGGIGDQENRIALAYNNASDVAMLRFFDTQVVDGGGQPVLHLTSVLDGSGPSILDKTVGTKRTGPITSWSENPSLYESIFYTTFSTRTAFLKNSLSRDSAPSQLSASNFSLVDAGNTDGDSYGDFIGERASETKAVTRFCDLDFDGDADGIVKGDVSGYHFFENLQADNGLPAPSFQLVDQDADMFDDVRNNFINIELVDLDGNSFPDLVYTLHTTPSYDPAEREKIGLMKVIWNTGIHPYETGQLLFQGTGESLGLDVTDGYYVYTHFSFGDVDADLWRDLVVGYGDGGLRIWLNEQSEDVTPPDAASGITNSDFSANTKVNVVDLSWYPMTDATSPGEIGTGITQYRITRYDRATDEEGIPLSGTYTKSAAAFLLDVPTAMEMSDNTVEAYHQYIYVLQARDFNNGWSTPVSLPGSITGTGDLESGSVTASAQTYGPVEVLKINILSSTTPGYVSGGLPAELWVEYNYGDPGQVASTLEIVKTAGPDNVRVRFQGGAGPVDSWIVDGIDAVTIPIVFELTDSQIPPEGSDVTFYFRVQGLTPEVPCNAITVQLDMTAPEKPASIPTAALLNPGVESSKAMILEWDAFSEGGAGIASYTLTRQRGVFNENTLQYDFVPDGGVFTGKSIDDSPFTDNSTSILYGTYYRYTVVAIDNVGNISEENVSNVVETPENITEPPSPLPDITSGEPGDGYVDITWTRSYPRATGASTVWYRVYRKDTVTQNWVEKDDNITGTSYRDYGDVGQPELPEGTYKYYVEAYDNLDNTSDPGAESNWITVSDQSQLVLDYVEVTGPNAVDESSSAQFSCIAHFTSGTSDDVSNSATWSENSNYTTITQIGYLTASAVSSNQSVTVTASYTLDSVTRTGTKTVTIVNGGANLPANVAYLTVSSASYNPDNTATIHVDWPPTTGAEEYVLQVDQDGGGFLTISDEINVTDHDFVATESGVYTFRIKAINAYGMSEDWTVGNRAITVSLSGGSTELEPPENVVGVVDGSGIRISWDAVPNPGDYTALALYQGSETALGFSELTPAISTDLNPTSTTFLVPTQNDGSAFVNGEEYSFALKGLGPNNTESEFSLAASVEFIDTQLEQYTITASAGSGGAIDPAGDVQVYEGASQSFVMTPDSGKQISEVLVDDVAIDSAELEDAGGVFGGAAKQYTFENVMAVHTIAVTFDECQDVEDPLPPEGLYVRSAGNGGVDVEFSYAIDIGCSGIAGYDLYRQTPDGEPEQADSGASTLLTDGAAVAGETVSYYVISRDGAGNTSEPSETITIMVPYEDGSVPSAPVGLSYTVAYEPELSVNLNWKLAVDSSADGFASGVSVYEIFRSATAPAADAVPDGISRFTSWTDTTVDVDTDYTYWVRTCDMAGNVSPSTRLDVTVSAAQAKADATYVSYFPHKATATGWWTGFALVNTGENPANITFEFYNSEGTLLSTLPELSTMAAGEKIVKTIAALFETLELEVPEGTSWWRVISDQPLDGFELFGRPSDDGTTEEMVGVKIARVASERLLFPVVKVNDTEWTGIAVVNTSETESSSITFDAMSADGAILETSSPITVPAMGKRVRLAESFFTGETLPTGTTTLVMQANQPCIGFELFGYKDHTGLAGVSGVSIEGGTEPSSKQQSKHTDDPSNLHVVSLEGNVVTLAWDPPTTGEYDTYKIYTVVDHSSAMEIYEKVKLLGEVPVSETSIVLTLAEQTTYRVAVFATPETLNSDGSNDVTFTTLSAPGSEGTYLYVVPRVDIGGDQGGDTQIVARNRSDAEAQITAQVWVEGQDAPVITEVVVPALGSHTFTAQELGLTAAAYVVELIATQPLTVCEVFEGTAVGYYDSLFAFTEGLDVANVTHIAVNTTYWDSYLTIWNPSPYYNEVEMTLYTGGGGLVDTSGTEDANPVIITIPPFGVARAEIHEFVANDANVRNIGWIRLDAQFPINGYFDYGTKAGFKISAIELE